MRLNVAILAVSAAMASAAGSHAGQPGYRVHGVTAYDVSQLLNFAHAHVHLADGYTAPDRLADAIELVYREDGYFLAEADAVQDSAGNTIVTVDEGRIDSVVVEGVDALVHARIEIYVRPLIYKPGITQAEFERVLMLINDLAGITAVAEFEYPNPGSGARLVITARQMEQAGSATIDNPPRDLGRGESFQVTQEFFSLFTGGDVLRLQGSATYHFGHDGDGQSYSGSAYYRAPVCAYGSYGEIYGGTTIGRRDASGSYVSTELNGKEAGIVIGHPFVRDIHNYAYGLIEARHSSVESSGGGVTFQSGVNAVSAMALFGVDDEEGAPIRAGIIGTAGWRSGSVSSGQDDGDNDYFHLRLSFGTSQPLTTLDENFSFRLEAFAQYTHDRLPAVEEFYLGSRYLLRGYGASEAAGDSGAIGTFELNYAWPEPVSLFSQFNTYAFLDAGIAVNNQPGVFETVQVSLFSAGAGLRARLEGDLLVNAYVGVPILDGPNTEKFDPGFYLGVTKQW